MSILKLFNFMKGKKKDDAEYYEYGMTHKQAVMIVLKKSKSPLGAEEIMHSISAQNIKLRRPIKHVASLKSLLFKLFYKEIIKHQPHTGKWSI